MLIVGPLSIAWRTIVDKTDLLVLEQPLDVIHALVSCPQFFPQVVQHDWLEERGCRGVDFEQKTILARSYTREESTMGQMMPHGETIDIGKELVGTNLMEGVVGARIDAHDTVALRLCNLLGHQRIETCGDTFIHSVRVGAGQGLQCRGQQCGKGYSRRSV